MHSKKPRRRPMPPLCSELREDDGVDPREFFRAGKSPSKAGRKTLQLCSQVRDALNYLLAGDSGDELLSQFQVADVRPAPDATQLLVIVQPVVQPSAAIEASEVLARLANASGRLRAGVAAAITRKRAPQLLFQIVGLSWRPENRP